MDFKKRYTPDCHDLKTRHLGSSVWMTGLFCGLLINYNSAINFVQMILISE